ncbi:3-(3-hydroxy-phenyl)propionate transporter MhpT [Paraburkholderia sp. EG286B]|uniref:3-(3-hydroxy-phenyl)propionate transporter MhpT n=1 Tax=Paraburkholderia sp. EG286B TaxID=3237011 RepID=UPI0034D2201B
MTTPQVSSAGLASKKGGLVTICICMLVAMLDGVDLQSVGMAATRMAKEFSLSPAQLGWIFGTSAFGLLVGAAVGGRLADWLGRKRVLVPSVALFGLFSLATTQVGSFDGLLVARFLTGLGLGAAAPLIVVMGTEAVSERWRNTAVGAMMCGMPFGAALVALLDIVGSGNWRSIFYVGGFGPLVLLPLLAIFVQDSRQFVEAKAAVAHKKGKVIEALAGEGRVWMTAALWIAFIGTQIVAYFMMNWVPSLAAASGLTHTQASMVLVLFDVGAAIGMSGMGYLADAMGFRKTIILVYLGLAVGLAMFAAASGLGPIAFAGLICGLFIMGGQTVLSALAGYAYPTSVRGTGVGSAIAVGRVGATLGPLAAGLLFSQGQSGTALVIASIPLIVLSALAALLVVRSVTRRRRVSVDLWSA